MQTATAEKKKQLWHKQAGQIKSVWFDAGTRNTKSPTASTESISGQKYMQKSTETLLDFHFSDVSYSTSA